MMHLDLSSKRARLALRFFTYGVMTISTIVLTIVLIFFALGYRFDRNFTFSQGGLVQFRSFPESAEVTVDGKKQSFKTPGKLNLPAGHHQAEMSLAGYRSWSKGYDVSPGQLLWLNYIRLVPNSITTTTVKQFDGLADTMPSPDRHWIMIVPKADVAKFVLADISNEKEPKFTDVAIPDQALTKHEAKLGKLSIVEWDLGARYVLVRHEVGGTVEFIRVDRTRPAEAVNITQRFSLAISEAHFSGSNPNVVFAKTDTVLRKLDLGGNNASGALVTNLEQFLVYGSDVIAYTRQQEKDDGTKQRIVGIWKDNKTVSIRTVPISQTVMFAYGEYDDHKYLAIATTDSGNVDIIRDPATGNTKEVNSLFAQLNVGRPVKGLKFNDSGRMLVAQYGSTFASYDLEEAKSYQATLGFGADRPTPLQWLDDYYLWSDAGGRLRWIEFDSQNERDITGVATGFDVTLSSNGKRLFSFGKTSVAGRMSLQSSNLTTED